MTRERLLDILMVVSLLMVVTWLILHLLDLLTHMIWLIYTRGYREYLFLIGVSINILLMALRRRR